METKISKSKVKDAGITMIALVVTIVVLLILASITIGAVTSDNGILRNANDAKEQTEIAEEKEIVDRASLQAMGNNKRGNLVEDELQEQLDRITDNGKTEVSDNGEEFEVVFIDSNRYYNVDRDGNIIEEGKIVIDKSPGDITKDENGNNLKGDESEPYEIWCIEDLVAFSKNVNEGNRYYDKYIRLMRDLDFNSKNSYTDWNTKDYDIYLNGDGNKAIREQLSSNGNGFKIIGMDSQKQFWGEFDGNHYSINNIYMKQGFFGDIAEATIKDLYIEGKLQSENNAGGIIVRAVNSYIYNCYNNVTVTRSNCWWNMLLFRKQLLYKLCKFSEYYRKMAKRCCRDYRNV